MAGTEIEIIHTPGHSPGSVCLYLPEAGVLFSGDTLFNGGPGATGRSYCDFPTIIDSIRTSLFTLPEDTRVHTGHGDHTPSASKRPISPNGSRGGTEIVRGSDPDKYDFDENDVVVTHEKSYAAGVPAVLIPETRPGADGRGAHCAHPARLNQPTVSTARAVPGRRPGAPQHAEFCENGAKAVAEEATTAPGRPGLLRRAPGRRPAASAPTTGSASRAG